MRQEFEKKLGDAIESGLRAAELTPIQVRIFGNAFAKTLGIEPFTMEVFKMHHVAWEKIDKGLRDLMAGNDQLTDAELKAKSKRLKCLSDFAETLRKRVNERVNGVSVGPVEPLFTEFFTARNQVDETTN